MSKVNYGTSITARNAGENLPQIFISGKQWEAGYLAGILPLREGDYVPVWEKESQALRVIKNLPSRHPGEWVYQTIGMSRILNAPGGRIGNSLAHGVEGFILPPAKGQPGK